MEQHQSWSAWINTWLKHRIVLTLIPALIPSALAIPCPRACQLMRTQVLRLPMAFFDAQPAGRLLNRFSKDTEAADILLRENTAYWISETCARHLYLILTLRRELARHRPYFSSQQIATALLILILP